MRESCFLITAGGILCRHFMYKSFIHCTDEVIEVPVSGSSIPCLHFVSVPGRCEVCQRSTTEVYPHGIFSLPVTLYTQYQWSSPASQVLNFSISSLPEYFSGGD